MNTRIKGILLGSRVIVFNVNDARKLYRLGFYGKPLGVPKLKSPDEDFNAPLELDLIEALYLTEKGILTVVSPNGEELDSTKLKLIGEQLIPSFNDLYRVYKLLRERGYVVRSGLKYGADFAVYEHGPGIDHAPYLVHVIRIHEHLDPLEIVRAGRLSHSVRKKFVLAVIDDAGRITFIGFEWFKP